MAIQQTTEQCKNRVDLKPLPMPKSSFRSKQQQQPQQQQRNEAKPFSKDELEQEAVDFALDAEDLFNIEPTTTAKPLSKEELKQKDADDKPTTNKK